jgi:hypothetical protein
MNRILIFFLFLAGALSAQESIIKLDIHAPVARTGVVSFEHVLNENSSLGLSVLFCDRSDLWVSEGYISRLAISPEYRFYLTEDLAAPQGWYLNALLRYQHLRSEIGYTLFSPENGADYVVDVYDKDTFGMGIGIGYQRIFKNKVAVDLHMGTLFNSGEERNVRSEPFQRNPYEPYVGYFLFSGLKVGYVIR